MRQKLMGNYKGTIGMYLRLSSEDEDTDFVGKKYESESITNQRKLIRDYILGIEELEGYDVVEFVDDGLSGTNMERPGFREMIAAAEKGLVDVIIVKDLSRIGRNYVEVGNILEQEFPAMNIRVIAINDSFDSDDYEGTTAGMAVIIKMMTYDLYSKQLSSKVKEVQYRLMEEGRFVNTPPYGYMVLPEKKHQLVIDEEAAKIVRLIFKMVIKGISSSDVALHLNEQGILPPSEYKKLNKRNARFNKNPIWTHPKIVDIIRNEKYRGAMVYHTRKKQRVSDKQAKRTKKDTWLVIEGTHEPIVSDEEFRLAQEALVTRKITTRKKPKPDNVYVCPYCGFKLRKTYGNDTYLSCSHVMYTGNEDCKKIYWSKTDIENVIYQIFCVQVKLYLTEQTRAETDMISRDTIKEKKQVINFLNKSYAALNFRKSELYDKYKDGELDRDAFIREKSRYADEGIRVKKEIEQAEQELRELEEAYSKMEWKKQEEKKADSLLNLPADKVKEVMYNFIDQVLVYDDKNIKVKWNFADGLGMVS